MRCELVAITVCAVLGARVPRAAADLRVLVAADSYLATTRSLSSSLSSPALSGDAAADVSWSAHLEARDPERSFVADWVERESLIGGTPRRELHELSYVERGIGGLEITLGRFRVPGGFWLIADGAGVAMRSGALTAGVFGGSRSFTNGRTETLLSSAPHPLPLVGAHITLRGDIEAAASYTYTADRVSLYRGDGATVTRREPEQFVDAELAATIGERGFVMLGATAGSRYLVTFPGPGAQVTDDPALENVWFGSQSLYAQLVWRLGGWRLDAGAAALRTKLGETSVPELAAIDGSFLEGTAHATWHPGRAWRIDGRYRARLRDDGSRSQRAEIALEWRRGALDVQLRGGVDLHHDAMSAPGFVPHRTLLYRASIGRKTAATDLAIGAAATAAIGDELATSPGDDRGDQRAPYTLEARSYGFVHLFATHGPWFGGLDGEASVHGDGVRVLVQIGFGR